MNTNMALGVLFVLFGIVCAIWFTRLRMAGKPYLTPVVFGVIFMCVGVYYFLNA